MTKPLVLQSVNGPEVTIIKGYQVPGTTNGPEAIRCVYLTNGAVLSGFTLTGGATALSGTSNSIYGGGVWCESTSAVISNCVLTANSAYSGGGCYKGTLYNCTLVGNSAVLLGGGSHYANLNNCTIKGNSAGWQGGGAAYGILSNCTVNANSSFGGTATGGGGGYRCVMYGCAILENSAMMGGGSLYGSAVGCVFTRNSSQANGGGTAYTALTNCTVVSNYGGSQFAPAGVDGQSAQNCIIYSNSRSNGTIANFSGTLNYCCTYPLPSSGVGNFTNAPLFLDLANGNLRLQGSSPCINAGNNLYAIGPTDLDGNPRIQGGTVDTSAYEYQSPASSTSYAWLYSYGLTPDSSTDASDVDSDGMTVWQEWMAGTNPTNAGSVLKLQTPVIGPAQGDAPTVTLTWSSVLNRFYSLERAEVSAAVPVFYPILTNIQGAQDITSRIDATATNPGPYLYRVRVE